MRHALTSHGFAAAIKAVNEDSIVVLHRFKDGMLLVVTFDDEMPAFTTKPAEPGASLDLPKEKDVITSATGYVFHIAEPNVNGAIEFEGQRYAMIDIEDYIVWTDEEAVQGKYEEVVGKARAE